METVCGRSMQLDVQITCQTPDEHARPSDSQNGELSLVIIIVWEKRYRQRCACRQTGVGARCGARGTNFSGVRGRSPRGDLRDEVSKFETLL